ncbi:MAG: 2-oxoacid:acceptor oxidoreductase family protein, partial [Deltaproteobacteria bacterium]|nr:2-oxoacid:acceptor oxidoreductase family protein [Deltaproteobacteria bacterium]
EELVKPTGLPATIMTYGVPATRFAEELGRKMVLNIVMVGFFTSITRLIGEDAMRKAVADSVPPNTIDLNVRAFDKGLEFGKKLRAERM